MNKDQKNIEQLNLEIAKLKEEIIELTTNWKRALADYQNLEKRQQEDKSKYTFYILNDLFKKLLPVFDLYTKAAAHLKDKGLEIAQKEMDNVLKGIGITEINEINIPFDPNLHEAVASEFGSNDNLIVEIITKGYLYNNYLIRPAQVKVSKLNNTAG